MNSCTLTVVHFPILHQKLVFLLTRRTCTDSFSVGVVTRDKGNIRGANLTSFTVNQPILLV